MSTPSNLIPSAAMIDHVYGPRNTAERKAGAQDFETIHQLVGCERRATTAHASGEVRNHLGLYFQGSSGFLKVQRYEIRTTSREISAKSLGNHSMANYEQRSWAFCFLDNRLEPLGSIGSAEVGMWSIPSDGTTTVYVLCVYDGAKSCVYGSEQVWVQCPIVGLPIRTLEVVFGGRLRRVEIREGFRIKSNGDMFERIPSTQIFPLERAYPHAMEMVAPAVESLLRSRTFDLYEDSSPFRRLWTECMASAGRDGDWAGLKVHSVRSDLLFIATGSPELARSQY